MDAGGNDRLLKIELTFLVLLSIITIKQSNNKERKKMSLKKIVTPIVLMLFIVLNAFTAFAGNGEAKDTGKDIFIKTIAALGGLEKISSIKTLKYTMDILRYIEDGSGTENMHSISVIRYPDKYWYHAEVLGYIAITTTNGKTGWTRLTKANEPDSKEPYKISPERDKQDLLDYNLRDLFYISQNLDKYNFTVNGEKDFDGKKTFEILITGLYTFQVYIDTRTYLPVGVLYWATSPIDKESIENREIYSDYKAVDGILVPFRQNLFAKGKIWAEVTIKEVKFNIEVSDDFFEGK